MSEAPSQWVLRVISVFRICGKTLLTKMRFFPMLRRDSDRRLFQTFPNPVAIQAMTKLNRCLSRALALVLVFAAVGCNWMSSPSSETQAGRLKSPADPLAPTDLDRLLAVVQTHGGGAIPEFTPTEDDRSVDYNCRADELVSEIRGQLGTMFNPERQGQIWAADEKWTQSFAQHQMTGPEFAALVRSVSCAIMRVRLSARVDVDHLVDNARAEVKELVGTIEAIDEIPESERSRQDAVIRGRSAISLARTAALLEFAEMIKQVPPENCKLVRKYSKQLKPLLPAGGTDGLLSELQALGESPRSDVVPAGHTADEGE